MKWIPVLLSGCLLTLVSCSGGRGIGAIYHPDVGPFDKNGDYVEALADAPVRKNVFSRRRSKPASKVTELAEVGPPAVSAAAGTRAPKVSSSPSTGPILIARSPRRESNAVSRAVPTRTVAPRTVSKSKPKSKSVATKPKKRASRHVVRRSDTLYGLSRKYGVTVKAIQRANGLRGTKIITGKALVIPR